MSHLWTLTTARGDVVNRPKGEFVVQERARQLLELLHGRDDSGAARLAAEYPKALDLDATGFLNRDVSHSVTNLVFARVEGSQIIVSWFPEGRTPLGGRWEVLAEVDHWEVTPLIRHSTLPGYFSGTWPDPVRQYAARYYELGASLETSGASPPAVYFPEAVVAADYTTDLWALLSEHGIGALFRTTLVARVLCCCGGESLWSTTRYERLKPLAWENPAWVSTRPRGKEEA